MPSSGSAALTQGPCDMMTRDFRLEPFQLFEVFQERHVYVYNCA